MPAGTKLEGLVKDRRALRQARSDNLRLGGGKEEGREKKRNTDGSHRIASESERSGNVGDSHLRLLPDTLRRVCLPGRRADRVQMRRHRACEVERPLHE
jgi:hypothetical protein